MRLVMKFGGTSVGSADAIRRVTEIVGTYARDHEVVVVVSAMNAPDLRTTDTLIAAAKAAAAGNGDATAQIALVCSICICAQQQRWHRQRSVRRSNRRSVPCSTT